MSKKVLSHFKKKSNGNLDTNNPIKVNYSKADKIKYYSARASDSSLTAQQKNYAKGKVKTLSSGKGLIAITDDKNFKGGKGKQRRVMISGINHETGEKMVNRISSTSSNTAMKLNRVGAPILQKESYLDQEVHIKKKKGSMFKDEDLVETTSTINPFDYKKVFKFIFKGDSSDNQSRKLAERNTRLGKKYK